MNRRLCVLRQRESLYAFEHFEIIWLREEGSSNKLTYVSHQNVLIRVPATSTPVQYTKQIDCKHSQVLFCIYHACVAAQEEWSHALWICDSRPWTEGLVNHDLYSLAMKHLIKRIVPLHALLNYRKKQQSWVVMRPLVALTESEFCEGLKALKACDNITSAHVDLQLREKEDFPENNVDPCWV